LRTVTKWEVTGETLSSLGAARVPALRANIAETTPLALITEQGENRNQREKQCNLSGFPHGFACRGT
jgi:hypothetical protein